MTFDRVGTLGDANSLSTSLDAVSKWGGARVVVPYATFETAAEATLIGAISAFAVPAAYPAVAAFIMHPQLRVGEVFLSTIRPIVCARSGLARANVARVHHHPATVDLVAETSLGTAESVPCRSNAAAAREAARDLDSAAITNDLCARHYDLSVVQVLRRNLRMPFLCFVAFSGRPSSVALCSAL